ncbi:hypothetical protein [Fimbriimonas ginsengisoli]|uniref:Uncharacterized protein n=1 Tax=Fimbriimonas ginsengisoli Gsoil 348 TaxID=661478 RepID=A0A068NJB5_FIMGI|nr:hypothetical protein [Fimbriimonas ginsengisoli]AIE83571.1 hypothetical protein OP10G_0203 [Fimbriimonas ginsengisoli Gsoil 348]
MFIGLVVLAFIAVAVRPWEDDEASGLARGVLTLFGAVSLLLLGITVAGYMGLGPGGSPRIPARALARIQQVGLYTRAPEGSKPALTFTGDPIRSDAVERDGFQIPGLGAGQRVRLIADAANGAIKSWRVEGPNIDTPVRIDGKIVNGIPGGWLQRNDTYQFTFRTSRKEPERFIAVTLEGDGDSLKIGYRDSANPKTIQLAARQLREGARLTTLLQAAGLATRFPASNVPLALQAGTDVDPWSMLGDVCVVRERKGDSGSKIGVLIDPALADDGVQVLRNDKPLDLRAATAPSEIPATQDATLSFGFTGSQRFALKLPAKIDESRLVAEFEVPVSYPLPPKAKPADPEQSFLMTSGRDMVPMDGFVFPTGNDNHPFYAKALARPDSAGMTVQDGVSERSHGDDAPVYLGDLQQGIEARFHVDKPSVPGAGRLALFAFAGLGVLFGLALWWRARPVGRGDVAWAFLWVGTVALLTVRLLLAYRCSLLPPDDATLSELVSFHKALRVSLFALVAIPAAMALARLRYLPVVKQRQLEGTRKQFLGLPFDRICLVLPALGMLAPILARIFGTRNDLFGIRTSIWTHLLLIAGFVAFALAVAARKDTSPAEGKQIGLWHRRGLTFFVVLNLLALAMNVLAVGDNGALVYGLSIGLALLVAWLPFRALQTKRSPRGFTSGVAIALGVALLALVALSLNRRFFIQHFETFNGTVAYRLASLDDLDPEMLLNPARTEHLEATQYRNNREQQWQMLLYAAVGASDKNPGYGGAPLSKVALKYPTSMTDTTYSIYVLGEFGPWAGAWLTALYMVIMAACFAGAASARRDGSWMFVPLAAIGGFFAANGLYMAAANTGSLPFTGQNLPLLSLYSQGDVLQGLVLLTIASVLLKRRPRGANVPPKAGSWLFTAFGVGSGLLWLGVARAGIGMPVSFTQDLDAPEVMRQVVKRVEQGQVKLSDSGHIDPESVPGLSPIEKEAIREFNFRADKSDPQAGLYYIQPNAAGSFDLEVNRAYFHLSSPYKRGQGIPWRKSILAAGAGEEAPRLYMLSSPLSLSLNQGGFPEVVWIDSAQPVTRANAAILAARSPFGRVEFAEYRRRKVGKKTFVTLKARIPQSLPRERGWGVFVEGKPVPDAGLQLQPNDLVSIEDRTGRSPRRYNLIYLGTQAEPLAFVRWRNGAYRRVFPGGPSFGMVANLGRVGDEVKPKDDLKLTLDLGLHRRLQDALRSWCLQQSPRSGLNWKLEDPERTKPVSMTLIDTFKGDVLALPSFPHVDPTSDLYEDDFGRSGPIRRGKLLRNWNFENHVIGSTIKPLTFSTMAVKLLPKYHLEDAVVHNRTLEHDNLGGIPLETPTAPYPPAGSVTMSEFLTQSRTWPACVIGALGLVESTDELKTTLVPDAANADITLEGKPYRINLLNSPNRVVSREPRTGGWVPRTNLSDTLLFQGLSELYDVQIPPNKTTESEAVHQRMASFLPTLAWQADAHMPTFASEVVPRRVLYECDSMHSVKQELLTSLIGGAQSVWNNVSMAEAFARLSTGLRVSARLEQGLEPHFPLMPAPISLGPWREKALLTPLERVHISGTAKSIQVDFKGYRAIMKTGTLGEEIDSESLMFTIGRFQNGAFVPGKTVTGYFFMRDTNTGGAMLKFSLANRLLPLVVDYLEHRTPEPLSSAATAKKPL